MTGKDCQHIHSFIYTTNIYGASTLFHAPCKVSTKEYYPHGVAILVKRNTI